MLKAEARKIARAEILKMSDAEREWACGAIADALSGIQEYVRAHSVFIYLGTETEPDTQEIVGLALAMEKTVSVPRVRGDEMDAVIITPYTDFKRNKWDILEPVGGRVTDCCEAAVIPLVAFDGLNRVGHGKGYYDKYLSSHECVKIGLAFDCQSVGNIDADRCDVPLDILITEKRVIRKNCTEVNRFYAGGAV